MHLYTPIYIAPYLPIVTYLATSVRTYVRYIHLGPPFAHPQQPSARLVGLWTFPQLAGLFVIADRHFVALLLRALPRGSGMLVMRTGKLDKISL